MNIITLIIRLFGPFAALYRSWYMSEVSRHEIGSIYDLHDLVWMNNWANTHGDIKPNIAMDYTAARYNGNYSISLYDAQKNKYDYLLNFTSGKTNMKILDLGCGWGNAMFHLNGLGHNVTGVTISQRQANFIKSRGGNVIVGDYRTNDIQNLFSDEKFDLIISIGSFEHLNTIADAKHNRTYKNTHEQFIFWNRVLKADGVIYFQTMAYSDKGNKIMNRISHNDDIVSHSIYADDDYILYYVQKFYQDASLVHTPVILQALSDIGLKIVSIDSGVQDYIATLIGWRKMTRELTITQTVVVLYNAILYHPTQYLLDSYESKSIKGQSTVFKRELFDHWRIVLRKGTLVPPEPPSFQATK